MTGLDFLVFVANSMDDVVEEFAIRNWVKLYLIKSAKFKSIIFKCDGIEPVTVKIPDSINTN